MSSNKLDNFTVGALRSLFLDKVNRMTVYFHFWFYKLFVERQPFTSDLKTTVLEFFFIEVFDCKFTTKGLHQGFFPVNFDKFLIFFTG